VVLKTSDDKTSLDGLRRRLAMYLGFDTPPDAASPASNVEDAEEVSNEISGDSSVLSPKQQIQRMLAR